MTKFSRPVDEARAVVERLTLSVACCGRGGAVPPTPLGSERAGADVGHRAHLRDGGERPRGDEASRGARVEHTVEQAVDGDVADIGRRVELGDRAVLEVIGGRRPPVGAIAPRDDAARGPGIERGAIIQSGEGGAGRTPHPQSPTRGFAPHPGSRPWS